MVKFNDKYFDISIHALRKESDFVTVTVGLPDLTISIHALRKESDITANRLTYARSAFQSTLSVRRATSTLVFSTFAFIISIHALRKESDGTSLPTLASSIISIHALRKESDPPP